MAPAHYFQATAAEVLGPNGSFVGRRHRTAAHGGDRSREPQRPGLLKTEISQRLDMQDTLGEKLCGSKH